MTTPTTPRKKAAQSRSKATVEAIVEAAARVFVERGFDGASTNRIAKVAGVSIGSLYQYFPNKAALAAELIERHLGELVVLMSDTMIEVARLPLGQGLPALVRAMFEAHRKDPELHRMLLETGSRVGMDRRNRDVIEQIRHDVERYLGAHAGEIQVRHIGMAAYLLVHAAENVMREVQLAPPPYPLDALIEEVSTMCLRYLGVLPNGSHHAP